VRSRNDPAPSTGLSEWRFACQVSDFAGPQPSSREGSHSGLTALDHTGRADAHVDAPFGISPPRYLATQTHSSPRR